MTSDSLWRKLCKAEVKLIASMHLLLFQKRQGIVRSVVSIRDQLLCSRTLGEETGKSRLIEPVEEELLFSIQQGATKVKTVRAHQMGLSDRIYSTYVLSLPVRSNWFVESFAWLTFSAAGLHRAFPASLATATGDASFLVDTEPSSQQIPSPVPSFWGWRLQACQQHPFYTPVRVGSESS